MTPESADQNNCCQILEMKLFANNRVNQKHSSEIGRGTLYLYTSKMSSHEYTASMHEVREAPRADPVPCVDLELAILHAISGSGTVQTALTAGSV